MSATRTARNGECAFQTLRGSRHRGSRQRTRTRNPINLALGGRNGCQSATKSPREFERCTEPFECKLHEIHLVPEGSLSALRAGLSVFGLAWSRISTGCTSYPTSGYKEPALEIRQPFIPAPSDGDGFRHAESLGDHVGVKGHALLKNPFAARRRLKPFAT